MEQTGLRNLAGLFLGGRITKGPQTSNWARPNLSPNQLRYAATDAWACRELYLRFETLGLLSHDARPVT
jgi:ribonuclease D